MKTIRLYVSIALMNAVLVVSLIGFGGLFRDAKPGSTPEGIAALPTATVSPDVTPVPRVPRRVVRIVRKKSQASASGTAPGTASHIPESSGPVTVTSAPTDAPQPTQDSRCLITIDGASYDVTAFRSMHSGGDIFRCGADMSQAFWSQHGQNTLDKMARYRI